MLQEDDILRKYYIYFDTYSDKDVILEYFSKKGYDIDDYNYERKKTVFYDKDAEMYYFSVWTFLDLTITNVSGYPIYDLQGTIHGTIRIALVSSETMPVGGETVFSTSMNGTTTIAETHTSIVASDHTTTTTMYSYIYADHSCEVISSRNTVFTNGTTQTTEYILNDDGTSESTTTTENLDGSESISHEEYNENGNLTSSSTTTDYSGTNSGTSPDGWETITSTTIYDENGNPESGSTEWTDPSGNENTQSVEYDEYGNQEVVGYEIDTTNNPNGGESLNNPIDTGVLAFDGRDFDIHLKAKFYWSNIQYASGTSTKLNPILNLSGNDTNNKVNGFLIAFLSRGSGKSGNPWWNFNGTQDTSSYATIMRVTKYLNDTASQVYHMQKSPGTGTNNASGIGSAQNATGSDIGVIDITCRSNVFHISVTNNAGTLQSVCQSFNKTPYTDQDLNFGSSTFQDVTVELGHWDSVIDGVQYSFNYEVLEFNVTKL